MLRRILLGVKVYNKRRVELCSFFSQKIALNIGLIFAISKQKFRFQVTVFILQNIGAFR